MNSHRRPDKHLGFTLIELMVVMSIVAMLATLALPKYFHSVARSRETVLRHDLRAMRDSIDQFFADRGRYPTGLDELTERRYLRSVPVDPITNSSNTWIPIIAPAGGATGMRDVRSGAPGNSLEGEPYENW